MKSAINSRVAVPTDEQFLLTKEEAVNAIHKKRNWSTPGPDRITNYWWKQAYSLHEGVSNAFMKIVQHDHEYPLWFAEGKTSLIPKAGEFSIENQCPITCLNNMYKWFTSCMLKPMNQHLDKYSTVRRKGHMRDRGIVGAGLRLKDHGCGSEESQDIRS